MKTRNQIIVAALGIFVGAAWSLHGGVVVDTNADGSRVFRPDSVSDMTYFNEAAHVLLPGDRIILPSDGDAACYSIVSNAAATLDAGVFLAREPGAVFTTSSKIVVDSGSGVATTNAVNSHAIVVVPRPADAPGGVWVRRNAIPTTGSPSWTDPADWVCISGDSSNGYPNGPDVCAILVANNTDNVTLAMNGAEITVGYLMLELDCIPSKTLTIGKNDTTARIDFKTTQIDPATRKPVRAWFRSGIAEYTKPRTIQVPVRFLVDTDVDHLDSTSGGLTFNKVVAITNGATLRVVRRQFTDKANNTMVFNDDLVGSGTYRVDTDAMTGFKAITDAIGSCPRSFTGILDVAAGHTGSSSGEVGPLCLNNAYLCNAKELIVRGAFAYERTLAAPLCNAAERVQADYDGVDVPHQMLPKVVTLDGGSITFGKQLKTNQHHTIPEMRIKGSTANIGFRNRYSGTYCSTTRVARLTVDRGATARVTGFPKNRSGSQFSFFLDQTPEGAVQDPDNTDIEVLPFFYEGGSGGNATDYSNINGHAPIVRDRMTGLVFQHTNIVVTVNQNGTWPENAHVWWWWNGGKSETEPGKLYSVTDGLSMKWLTFSGGTVGFKFAASNSTLRVTSGLVDFLHTYNYNTYMGDPADEKSASSCVESPGTFYLRVHDMIYDFKAHVGCKIKTDKGFVKIGNGVATLCSDTSDTLSGGVFVNAGTLELGMPEHAANVGANDITVLPGATLAIVSEQPFSRGATVEIGDQTTLEIHGRIVCGPARTVCQKLVVDGKTLARGTYGATGSGAMFVDDDHFSGAGVLVAYSDDSAYGFRLTIR